MVFRDVEKGTPNLVLIGQIFRGVYILLQEEISPNHQNISLGLKPNPSQDHLGGKGYLHSKLGTIRFGGLGVHRVHRKNGLRLYYLDRHVQFIKLRPHFFMGHSELSFGAHSQSEPSSLMYCFSIPQRSRSTQLFLFSIYGTPVGTE